MRFTAAGFVVFGATVSARIVAGASELQFAKRCQKSRFQWPD
jgi:hypothetical protein